MRVIQPYQIPSELLNIINDSNSYLILVSPYINFNNWDRIKADLVKAIKRGVKIEVFTRLDVDNSKSWEEVEALGIKAKLIKNLHAKVYFNEKMGLVTSMNLLTSSYLNAIEFGSVFHDEDEIDELKKFVKQQLIPAVETETPNEEDIYISKEKFDIVLKNYLSSLFGENIKSRWVDGELRVNVRSNQYFIGIDKSNNKFYCYGIIGGKEFDTADEFIETNLKYIDFNYFLGNRGIEGENQKPFTSSNFNYLKVYEKKLICEFVADFITHVSDFKRKVREYKKK